MENWQGNNKQWTRVIPTSDLNNTSPVIHQLSYFQPLDVGDPYIAISLLMASAKSDSTLYAM